ncbi:MAG: hypothetical protein E6J90_26545 [Deltaproteobacteria bacterium]|nr:MAG: hypothetical protein E6J91_35880 [Deltaproteobacteria bacterium]TMQ14621.1 MAG: hypothetical protein E6J90_26545 [Deltaproteobacteria bacterium]
MRYGKLIISLASWLALSSTAQAQPSGAQAETLFRQGKELMAKGQIAEACAAFDASQKLDPTIATLLNQAACREKNGQLATAWGLFLEAERQTRSAADEPTRQHHQTAASKAAKLEPRLSTLTISVPPENRVAGLEVTRGGERVDPGAWNKALPIDGGSYQISARAPGNAEWSSTITVGNEHDVKSIEIPRLKAAALDRPPVKDAAAQLPAESPPVAEHPRSRLAPFVLGGAAVGLAGAALGFELWASSTYDKAKVEPDDARQSSLWHSANTKRYLAEGFAAGSLAAAGVAVWLYLRPGKESPARASLQVAPIVASERAGLVITGSF